MASFRINNAPTKEELDQAIALFLKENKPAELGQVKQYLKKTNPSWQIPDRRLRKFVKSHSAHAESAQPDDVSLLSTASKRNRFGGLGLKMFSVKSKHNASTNIDRVPILEIKTPSSQTAAAVPPEEEDRAPHPIKEEKSPVSAATPPIVADSLPIDETETAALEPEKEPSLEPPFADENNYEQEKPCFACASCVVM